MIEHPAFTVEPWAVRETALDLERLAQTESVFALANGHIGLRGNLDEGEPFGLPGHVPERLLRGSSAAVRRGRLRLPGGRADGRQRHQRQAHPPARRGRAVRRPLRAAPQPRARARPARRRAAADRRSGPRRPDRRVRVSSTRLVSFAQRAVAAIFYEVEPLDGRLPVVVQSELVANEAAPPMSGDPRAAAALASPLVSRVRRGRQDGARCSCIPRSASELDVGVAMDHVIDGPGDLETSIDGYRGPRAADDHGRPSSRANRCGSSSSSPTAGPASARVPAVRDQVAAALAGAKHTGWDGLLAEAARLPRRLLGRAPTSSSTATRSSSRRSASRCSTRSRRARAASSGRSPPRG